MSLYLALARDIAAASRARDLARPENSAAIDVDFFAYPEYLKPLPDRRYCVAQFVWRGQHWRRERRLTGPKTFDAALDEMAAHIRRTGFPHVRDA